MEDQKEANRSREDTSFVANTFAFSLPLKDLIDMLANVNQRLKQTNRSLEAAYSKQQLMYTCLTVDQFLAKAWPSPMPLSRRETLYPIYGQPLILKAAINKRNDMIGHLNIMIVNLMQKSKENVFDSALYFSTEEDLFHAFLKLFHLKLFESPVFRKVLPP